MHHAGANQEHQHVDLTIASQVDLTIASQVDLTMEDVRDIAGNIICRQRCVTQQQLIGFELSIRMGWWFQLNVYEYCLVLLPCIAVGIMGAE